MQCVRNRNNDAGESGMIEIDELPLVGLLEVDNVLRFDISVDNVP